MLYNVLFICLSIMFTFAALVYTFYPDPFRVTKDTVDQVPYFDFNNQHSITSTNKFYQLTHYCAKDTDPVHIVFGDTNGGMMGSMYAIFHKYFVKYNVYVYYTRSKGFDVIKTELGITRLPALVTFYHGMYTNHNETGLWSNKNMKDILFFDEPGVTVF